uniref:Uncharacterized protein n=1 Tax=Arundo donax TaxID=35708 RepID=A0A0A9AWG7_ARUDO
MLHGQARIVIRRAGARI